MFLPRFETARPVESAEKDRHTFKRNTWVKPDIWLCGEERRPGALRLDRVTPKACLARRGRCRALALLLHPPAP